MKKKLVKKIQEGFHAIENNGSLDQLNKVLKTCFPKDIIACNDYYKDVFFMKNQGVQMSLKWFSGTSTTLPRIKVTDFFKPKKKKNKLEKRVKKLEYLQKEDYQELKREINLLKLESQRDKLRLKAIEERFERFDNTPLEKPKPVLTELESIAPGSKILVPETPNKKVINPSEEKTLEEKIKCLGVKDFKVKRWLETRNEKQVKFISVEIYTSGFYCFKNDNKTGHLEIIELIKNYLQPKNKTLEERLEELGCEILGLGVVDLDPKRINVEFSLGSWYQLLCFEVESDDEIIEKVKQIIEILK